MRILREFSRPIDFHAILIAGGGPVGLFAALLLTPLIGLSRGGRYAYR